MTPAELIVRVQTLDRAYAQEPLRPDAFVRIEAAMEGRSKAPLPRDSWRIRFSTALIMVMLGILAFLAYPSVHSGPGSFIVEGPDCAEASGDQQAVLEGNCRLRVDGLTVESRGRGIIDFRNGVMVVRTGVFLFQVGRRRSDDPLEIKVSHGTVVVTGTRFTLRQRQGTGDLLLDEGSVIFRHPDGHEERISIGDRFRWGREAPSVLSSHREAKRLPPVDPQTSVTRPPVGAEPSRNHEPVLGSVAFEEVVGKVSQLRSRRRYREAAQVLEETLRRRWSLRHARALSYELGSLVELQLMDQARACRHWRDHLRRFSGWPDREAVLDSLQRLGCD